MEKLRTRLGMALVFAMGIPQASAQDANNDHSVEEISEPNVTQTLTKEQFDALKLHMQQVRMLEYAGDPSFENASMLLSLVPTPKNMMYRAGFFSRVLQQHEGRLHELLEKAEKEPNYPLLGPSLSQGNQWIHRYMLCIAEWLANTEESNKEAFEALDYDPTMKGYLRISPTTERPDFTHLEALENGPEEAIVLDMAWGAYDATRDSKILASFLLCASRETPPQQGVRFWGKQDDRDRSDTSMLKERHFDLPAMAAKWSLQSRAEQDADFATLVDQLLKTLPPDAQERYKKPLPKLDSGESQYDPNGRK